jgi:hypothetical protein
MERRGGGGRGLVDSSLLGEATGYIAQSRQSAKLFLQSSELGLPQPLTGAGEYAPPPLGSGWRDPNSD